MNVCFVCEHGPRIGGGHIARQYSVAEWLAEYNVRVDLYTNDLESPFIDKFREIGAKVSIVPLAAINSFSEDHEKKKYQWCFIDGDQISDECELSIKKKLNCKTIRITDQPIHYRQSDVLINQNYSSDEFIYEDVPGQLRFFGLKHAMLRKIVRENIFGVSEKRDKKLITISLGNSIDEPIDTMLSKLMEYFSAGSFAEFQFNIFTNSRVIVAKAEHFQKNINIKPVSDDFIKSIKDSEFVICSAGTTMWECMALGTPYMAIALNGAQSEYVKILQKADICMLLPSETIHDPQADLQSLIDHYLDQKIQTKYKSVFETLLPRRYFMALEDTLGLNRRQGTEHPSNVETNCLKF